jgi:cysteine desulfurase/selenocysteine lyase
MSTTSDAGAQDNTGGGDASSCTQNSRWFVPDEQTLARLMSEMFRSSPGAGAPVPAGYAVSATQASPAPPPLLENPEASASLPAPGSRTAPPSAYPTAVPGVAGIAPNPISVPGPLEIPRPAVSGFGASVPGGPVPLQSPPGTPIPWVTPGVTPGVSPGGFPSANIPFGVPALSAALPGEAELKALLEASDFRRWVPSAEPPAPSGPSFYFLDSAAAPPSQLPNQVPNQVPNIGAGGFDVAAIRRDFPILSERVNGRPLVWLDNAATTQKPKAVIDRLTYFYEHENSNVHRAAHELAARSTEAYEAARKTVRRFLNASSVEEIVFVRGATEAINLVAKSWGRHNLRAGDEILITWLEHHANIVPWQQVSSDTGAILKVAPVDDRGQVLLSEFGRLLSPRTRLVSIAQVSNALGTVTPLGSMIEMARRYDTRILVDGAQAVSHMRVDVQQLDCDWYVFSGHKVFAPTGIGVLYGKAAVLEGMPPWQGGGNMIKDVTFEKTEYQPPALRFEAGTGNIADAAGLGAALEYLERVGLENVHRHEQDLLAYGTRLLSGIPGLRIIGTAPEKAGVLSFVIDGLKTEEIGKALNQEGIAVRAGHHCAQPILRRLGVEATVRPSLALYNNRADLDALAAAVQRIASGRGM